MCWLSSLDGSCKSLKMLGESESSRRERRWDAGLLSPPVTTVTFRNQDSSGQQDSVLHFTDKYPVKESFVGCKPVCGRQGEGGSWWDIVISGSVKGKCGNRADTFSRLEML